MSTTLTIWKTLEPFILTILAALVPLLVAWLRLKYQQLTATSAALEAERAGGTDTEKRAKVEQALRDASSLIVATESRAVQLAAVAVPVPATQAAIPAPTVVPQTEGPKG